MPDAPELPWPALGPDERRVLGVLVEKAKTTPDAYPLSLNALVTGCNQKSNRDPVMNLSDMKVEEALATLQKCGLVVRLTGSGRVERWRHVAYEAWKVDKVALAVLAELLLRGPQTEGELRGRASRMEPIDDLEQLRAVLKPLGERRLVVYLTPEGRRGTVLTHGFHSPDEFDRLRAASRNEVAEEGAEPAPAANAVPSRGEALAEIGSLKAQLAAVQARVADLAEQVRRLKEGLGIPTNSQAEPPA